MARTYPKLTEGEWRTFGTNLVTIVGGDLEAYGVPAPAFSQVPVAAGTYAAAFDAAAEPATRGPVATARKLVALDDLRRAVRPVVGIIQSNPAVNDAQRRAIGLKVRDVPTPAPVPPTPNVEAFVTGVVSARLRATNPADPNRRGRPVGTRLLNVYAYFGDSPVGDPSLWGMVEQSARPTVDLVWPDLADGSTAWLCCCWTNSRTERGGMSQPVSVRLAGTGVQPVPVAASATTGGEAAMKIAA